MSAAPAVRSHERLGEPERPYLHAKAHMLQSRSSDFSSLPDLNISRLFEMLQDGIIVSRPILWAVNVSDEHVHSLFFCVGGNGRTKQPKHLLEHAAPDDYMAKQQAPQ